MDELLLDLKNKIENKPHIVRHLFEKGFLITTKTLDNLEGFPFYNNWDLKK